MAAQQGASVSAASLPLLSAPHDSLRDGLPALKADAQLVHPVAAVQSGATAVFNETALQAQLYGSAFPARLAIEAQILGRVQRMPGCGIPSSRLGMDVMSGKLDEFGVDDFLGFPGEKEALPPGGGLHLTMEAALGLSARAPARGMM